MRVFSPTSALLAACFGLLLPAFAHPVPAKAAPKLRAGVTVTRLNWHGWPGCYRISNGVVEAFVVPQIGRIMAFQFAGLPQTNPLFDNKDWEGKTIADTDPTVWAAFGGDKMWPSPQSEWPKHTVRGWPPDQVFDGGPQIAQIVPGGIRLSTLSSVGFAARATRTITLRPGEARLYIAQTLIKDKDASNPPAPAETPTDLNAQNAAARSQRDGFPIGIWSVTQTRGDGTVWMPLSKPSKFPAGYTPIADPGITEGPPYFSPRNGLLRIIPKPKGGHKVGTDSPADWIASLYDGNVLFSEHHRVQPGAPYPDGGLPAEIYTNDKPVYLEMELLGPLVPLTHGNGTSHNIYWQLQRLPRVPKTRTDAEMLVKAAMQH